MKITKFRVNGQEAPVAESALDGMLLPAATAEDAGKAVVVGQAGSYELGEVGGSSDGIEFISFNTSTGKASKTAIEIHQSYQNGKTIVAVPPDGQPQFTWEILLQDEEVVGAKFLFIDVRSYNETEHVITAFKMFGLTIDNEGNVSFS